VEKLPPGRKVVQIIGVRKVPFARSSEDMARAAKEAAKKGDTTGIIDRADTIPADAEGNNRTVEVVAGEQTMDFTLTRRTGTASR
jgi:F420-0:gamma-glutamyl ligase